MKRIRVLIVEDSQAVREMLRQIIGSDPRLEVVGAASSAEQGLAMLHRLAPDVISMDIRLPGMNGFEATRRIMAERPTPTVVVSASVNSADLMITMNALKAGALTVIEKPVGNRHADYQAMADRLCNQLAVMSQIKVVRQRFNQPRRRPKPRHAPVEAKDGTRLLGIVASTGGPNALHRLLSGLGEDFPIPVVVVQHITASFQAGLVSWLDSVCPLPVRSGQHGERPQPGHIYVAPPDCHLTVGVNCLQLSREQPVCAERPSGTTLLRSMAQSLGPAALGVVLTGMGQDGAEGLAAIRAAGGYTIAEDESTAVVFGMPAAAIQLGAACEVLPLEAIAPRILELTCATAEVLS